ncbi:MAG: hypothetical protein BroJett011_59670 [Chloroflexota bacterium]|nr:MAG: hypothetical protein BroJett011_59670 [Chloroflexota bacterium]
MSCEIHLHAVGKSAAANAGIPYLSSKSSHIMGAMMTRLNSTGPKLLERVEEKTTFLGQGMALAGSSLGVAGPVNSKTIAAQKAAACTLKTGIGVAITAATYFNPMVRTAVRVAKIGQLVGDVAATAALSYSHTDRAGDAFVESSFFFMKTKRTVPMWRSSLTHTINRQDAMVLNQKNILSSDGMMFTTRLTTWHCGTSIIKSRSGERTITHLQSFSIPGQHYYFSGPLSKTEAANLASGSLSPEKIPGYVGQVSAWDWLCPAWAANKHTLIRSYLNFGPQTKAS